jgi:predicted XRE-type DNA-binding protein
LEHDVPPAKKTKRAPARGSAKKFHQLSAEIPTGAKPTKVAPPRSAKGRAQKSEKPLIPKQELAQEIATIIRYHHLNQTEAARIVGDAPSQISLLLGGKIEGFSTERLLKMLLRLGRDIELVFKEAPNPRAARFRISHKSSLDATT